MESMNGGSGTRAAQPAAADFNLDGLEDIVLGMAPVSSGSGEVKVFLANSASDSGPFSDPETIKPKSVSIRSGDNFGYAVAILGHFPAVSASWTTAVLVGAPGVDSNIGTSYVLHLDTTGAVNS